MATLLCVPTSFWLLNDPGAAAGPQQFDIAQMGFEPHVLNAEVSSALAVMTKAR